MALRQTSQPTVTIPAGCRDDVVPLSDPRAGPLVGIGVRQVALSRLVEGFEWPGPAPRAHLVLATVDGAGRLTVDGHQHHLGPGSVAVCPTGVPRRQWAEEPWRVITIRVADNARWRLIKESGPFVLADQDPHRFAAPVLGMLGEVPNSVTAVSGPSSGRVPLEEFINRFGAAAQADPDGADLGFPADPFSLYALALRIQLEALLAGPPSGDGNQRRLDGLWEAVRREPGGDWSVEMLAGHLNVSRATLHRLVATHHDSTPGAIVDRIRMDHAGRLLAHGNLPVKAIAAQVGYATPYSFSAAFRRSHGCPPSTFRALAIEEV